MISWKQKDVLRWHCKLRQSTSANRYLRPSSWLKSIICVFARNPKGRKKDVDLVKTFQESLLPNTSLVWCGVGSRRLGMEVSEWGARRSNHDSGSASLWIWFPIPASLKQAVSYCVDVENTIFPVPLRAASVSEPSARRGGNQEEEDEEDNFVYYL